MGAKDSFKVRLLILSGLILLISLVPVHLVNADAAPPQAPPGSSVSNGKFETNVQMVSEEVIIEVGYYPGPDVSVYSDQTIEELLEQEYIWGHAILSTGDLYAHIDATFIMKNQGDQDEAFDVWFPVETTDGWSEKVHVLNFQAWVNGVPSETHQRKVTNDLGRSYLWALWPATFPVGEEVIIRVSYDIPPTYEGARREFEYILETGAGWYDVIEEGNFIVRLPYEVASENTSFFTFSSDFSIKWDDLLISGNEIRWQFTDFEPVRNGNVQLWVLSPTIWTEIQTARSIAAANPDSLDAQLDLAQTLESAVLTHHGIYSGWNFALEAKEVYEHALELAPEDIDIYITYLELLLSFYAPNEAPPEEFLPTLEHALELAPENTRLLEIKEYYYETERIFRSPPTSTPQPSPSPIPTETPSTAPTVSLSPTRRPTQTPALTQTPAPTDTPDTPIPDNMSQPSNQVTVILIVAITLVALSGVVFWLFAHRSRPD